MAAVIFMLVIFLTGQFWETTNMAAKQFTLLASLTIVVIAMHLAEAAPRKYKDNGHITKTKRPHPPAPISRGGATI